MGAAARRKKLDLNYGKVISLSTPDLKHKHSEIIFEELTEHFKVELAPLFHAKTVPENYQTVTEEVRSWLHNKLLTYREEDRVYLAKYVFFMLVEIEARVSFSPVVISCIFKAVKDYFTPNELQGLLNKFNRELITTQPHAVDPCEQFAYKEISQEIKRSIAIDLS